MSIRRLDPDTNMRGLPLMVPADDGGYVDYDDHLAEVERLRGAHKPMADAVVAAYEFILRECAETNPETGEIVDAGALPTWHLVCEGYAAALAGVGDE